MFIYVGNLSVETNQQDLQNQFEQYGSVTSVNILTDEISGNPLGFAFVEMPEEAEALRAVSSLDRTRIRDRIVMVCETKEPVAPATKNAVSASLSSVTCPQ